MARLQHDVLVTMIDEIAYAVGILRSHYPEDSETELRARAEVLRANRYQSGRWPFDDASPAPMEAEPPPRKRGRPKGSKNHPKAPEAVG